MTERFKNISGVIIDHKANDDVVASNTIIDSIKEVYEGLCKDNELDATATTPAEMVRIIEQYDLDTVLMETMIFDKSDKTVVYFDYPSPDAEYTVALVKFIINCEMDINTIIENTIELETK